MLNHHYIIMHILAEYGCTIGIEIIKELLEEEKKDLFNSYNLIYYFNLILIIFH